MNVEQRKIHPQDLSRLEETCLWLVHTEGNVLPSFTQLDWNMCGALTRTLKHHTSHQSSLVPTLKRIPSEYILLQDKFDPHEFAKTCSGMKFETVAIVCGNVKNAESITAELQGQKNAEYPKKVMVCVEELSSL